MTDPAHEPIKDAARIAADAAAAERVRKAIDLLIRATVGRYTTGIGAGGFDPVVALANALGAEMSRAALDGADAVLKAFDAALKAADAPAPVLNLGLEAGVPKVPPTRAIEALLKREPRLATSAAQVAEHYARDRIFSIAKSIDLEITQKVHGALVEVLRSGVPTDVASKVVETLGDWSPGYAETVTRTNLMTAYSDGQNIAIRSPGIRDVMIGFEIGGPVDSSTRPNHAAAVGWRASADDPRWATMRCPLGFNCRHSLVMIDRYRADRNGWTDANGDLIRVEIPRGAHPDDGFRAGG